MTNKKEYHEIKSQQKEWSEQMEKALAEARAKSILDVVTELGIGINSAGHGYYKESGNHYIVINTKRNIFFNVAGKTGGDVVDYVKMHKGFVDWKDAVRWLVPHIAPADNGLGDGSNTSAPKPRKEPKERKPSAKKKSKAEAKNMTIEETLASTNFMDNRISRVVDYLVVERGIDRGIAQWLADKDYIRAQGVPTKSGGMIYNACFMWRDVDTGEIVGWDIKGIAKGSDFVGIASGSDNDKGFAIVKGDVQTVRYFEAAVDLLSYLTIYKGDKRLNNTLFVTMAGMSSSLVDNYRANYPSAKHILCVDNDAPADDFAAQYDDCDDVTRERPITGVKDFNEMLLAINNGTVPF